ncbi:glycosyltransferase family 2 protein [Bacillus gaemokensis]|uniref:Glycosyl transferase family 2 n=1 Tax=Bacillus gaemokensis TaxID=574375 RepID=A0A073KC56_9BACI|nr:glycosyltransferase family 2 protein [Bacillus gaemokensis]KEK24844.1 glycosyl transferase family 2 [Bacillus gaemokensis]KYG30154.1 glycosyl transferase family 2 [Bacillus gaemokensis]
MIIHVYALCWNEEKILPYFFKHYDSIADQYYIFDNDSTDNSLSILQSHPKVIINRFEIQGDSFVQSALDQYNCFWKQSKETADWVIICNIDEHLYHPNLRTYLQECTSNGITLIVPEGYEMVSDSFPNSDKPLYESVKSGARREYLDKPQVFNPSEIKDINFSVGRHSAFPLGNVKKPLNKEILLLHYKHIGFNYLNNRLSEQKTRLRRTDIANNWAHEYLWDEKKKLQAFERLKKESVKVL